MGLGDKIGNAAEEAKGKVKEATGKATDDRSLEAEGKGDQASAKVKQAGEKAKDAFRTRWTDHVRTEMGGPRCGTSVDDGQHRHRASTPRGLHKGRTAFHRTRLDEAGDQLVDTAGFR